MRGQFLVSFQLLDKKGLVWKDNYVVSSLDKVSQCIEMANTMDGLTLVNLEVKYPYFGENERISIYKGE